MSKKVTKKQVIKKLRHIVNTRGYEYNYEMPLYEDEHGVVVEALDCMYTDSRGAPSCIVGMLLSEVSPTTLKQLHNYEWGQRYRPTPIAVPQLIDNPSVEVNLSELFDTEALQVLRAVQYKQDFGYSWGEALDSAIKENK